MTGTLPTDPMALFREWVTQWENAANEYGGKVMNTPEFSQAMQQSSALGLKAQAAVHEAMAKSLAAANMPSRADVEALGARLNAIEAALARIEARLPGATPATAPPRPARTKRPPKGK